MRAHTPPKHEGLGDSTSMSRPIAPTVVSITSWTCGYGPARCVLRSQGSIVPCVDLIGRLLPYVQSSYFIVPPVVANIPHHTARFMFGFGRYTTVTGLESQDDTGVYVDAIGWRKNTVDYCDNTGYWWCLNKNKTCRGTGT